MLYDIIITRRISEHFKKKFQRKLKKSVDNLIYKCYNKV